MLLTVIISFAIICSALGVVYMFNNLHQRIIDICNLIETSNVYVCQTLEAVEKVFGSIEKQNRDFLITFNTDLAQKIEHILKESIFHHVHEREPNAS